jgi:hypothetical protein
MLKGLLTHHRAKERACDWFRRNHRIFPTKSAVTYNQPLEWTWPFSSLGGL